MAKKGVDIVVQLVTFVILIAGSLTLIKWSSENLPRKK